MNAPSGTLQPGPETLLEIIRIQTEIVRAGLDLGGVMALVTQRAQVLTHATGAVVELAENDDMVYRAASGSAARQLGMHLKRIGSLSGRCVEERRILHCTDSETDERVDRAACRKVGLRSMLVVPLNHLDETVGVLKVLSSEVGGFTEADIQVLGLMSELIAAAMFNATKLESSELYYRATHDALTDIANRSSFFDHLRRFLAHAERHSERVGILYLDVDGLKPINDAFGHRAGDATLKEIALRISGTCRQSDVVARIGGDEFGVILPSIENYVGASLLCDRLAIRIDQPLQFEQHQLDLGASIGLAVYPDDAAEMDVLLAKADASMYEAKRMRKGSRV
jgi:diguanylate cyclase (GGDEF)-like protein